VDISATIELKLAALACHQSQFSDFGALSARMRHPCTAYGKTHDCANAEPFDRILTRP